MVSVIRCKTLFITHYPQIGVELSQKVRTLQTHDKTLNARQHPGLVANAHMGYLEEELAGMWLVRALMIS